MVRQEGRSQSNFRTHQRWKSDNFLVTQKIDILLIEVSMQLSKSQYKVLVRVSIGALLGLAILILANISPLALVLTAVGTVYAGGDKYFSKEISWLETNLQEKMKLDFKADKSSTENDIDKTEKS